MGDPVRRRQNPLRQPVQAKCWQLVASSRTVNLEKQSINKVRIAALCKVSWDQMSEDGRIRQCALCKKNVYNISAMTEKHALRFVQENENKSWVWLYKRKDGTVISDNCPEGLRTIRDRCRKAVLAVILGLLWGAALASHAQGLVGAPVDPRYGQSGEVGQMADFGYDTARDLSRLCTGLSFLFGSTLVWMSRQREQGRTLKVFLVAWWALIVLPVSVHLFGTFLINNLGGIGGGL